MIDHELFLTRGRKHTMGFGSGIEKVGITPGQIERTLAAEPEVVEHERIEEGRRMWGVRVSVQGSAPVAMVIDNGINEMYVQVLVGIDIDKIGAALVALSPFAVLGPCVMDDQAYIRGAVFTEHSNINALIETLKSAAPAYAEYVRIVLDK